ncbi:hypothetical protein [Bacillus atrophaeus]|uniref:hypothetical protein n=1 Tax=Bacillus atrophaeus TaxID=1452 RepID=UPI003990899B
MKNIKKQKQKHTELLGKNVTDTELAQELGSLQQQLGQLEQSVSQLSSSQQQTANLLRDLNLTKEQIN